MFFSLIKASSLMRQSSAVVGRSTLRFGLRLLTILFPSVPMLRCITDTVFRSACFQDLSPHIIPFDVGNGFPNSSSVERCGLVSRVPIVLMILECCIHRWVRVGVGFVLVEDQVVCQELYSLLLKELTLTEFAIFQI